jgi:integrase
VNYLRFDSENNSLKFLAYAFKKLRENLSLSESSKRAHRTVLRTLQKFIPSDIAINHLNYTFIQKYDNWLRANNYGQNTIWNHHKTIKVYINQAIKEKIILAADYPYLNFKTTTKESSRRGITREEIKRIEALDMAAPEMVLIKDLFLFSCYTGLRFSDLQAINQDNLTVNGTEYTLDFVMQKTRKRVILPLFHLFNGKPQSIMLKYYSAGNKYIFPRISNQYVNRTLKLIASLANIRQTLTFHISRHTFCSRLAEIKPDPYLIKDLAGHADIRISMIYIHQSGVVIENKLKEIQWN